MATTKDEVTVSHDDLMGLIAARIERDRLRREADLLKRYAASLIDVAATANSSHRRQLVQCKKLVDAEPWTVGHSLQAFRWQQAVEGELVKLGAVDHLLDQFDAFLEEAK